MDWMRADPAGIVPLTLVAVAEDACDPDFVEVVAETAAPEASRHPARVSTSNARKVDSLVTSSPQQITPTGFLNDGKPGRFSAFSWRPVAQL
jgi:hypothetical protein